MFMCQIRLPDDAVKLRRAGNYRYAARLTVFFAFQQKMNMPRIGLKDRFTICHSADTL